mgnify:CR=1 FL=1
MVFRELATLVAAGLTLLQCLDELQKRPLSEGFRRFLKAAKAKVSAGKNYIGIKRLRAALAANPATRRALADRGISIGRVVGVDVYSSGAIRLYVL